MKACLALFVIFTMLCARAVTVCAAEVPKSAVPTGVGAEKAEALPAAENADPNAAGLETVDSVAVSVNGTNIMESQLDAMVRSIIKAKANKIPPQLTEQFRKQIRAWVLQELIAEHLLAQEIKEKNITISEADIEDEISAMLAKEGLSKEAFEALLQTYGTSLQEYKKKVRVRKRILYKKFFDSVLAGKIKIADQEVAKYYKDNIKQFTVPEQAKVSHILISRGGIEADSELADAKALVWSKAQRLVAQIKTGADFDKLAKVQEPGRRGGQLGFFDRDAPLPEKFKEAAFGLNIGQVSNIVETEYGLHIIKLIDRTAATVKDLTQVKQEILRELTQSKEQQLQAEYIEALKASAKIIYPPGKEPNNVKVESKTTPPNARPQAEPE